MTTLPQTTPMRLPRPNGQLSIPGPATIAAPTVPAAGQLSPGDIWRVIRSNVWLIVGLMVGSAIIGYFVNSYLLEYHSRYTAIGFVRVHTMGELSGGGESTPQQIEVELRTQSNTLLHESLWYEALQNPEGKIRQTSWWNQFNKPLEEAKEDLEDNFSVAPIMNSRLIRVAFQYSVASDTKTIVEELVTKHINNQKEFTTATLRGKASPLEHQVELYETRLNALMTRVRDKSRQIGDDTSGTSIVQFELNRLFDERLRVESAYGEAAHQLSFLDELNQSGLDPVELNEALDRSISFSDLRRHMVALEVQISEAQFQWGPDHPRVQQYARQLAAFEARRNDMREEIKAGVLSSLRSQYSGEAEAAQLRMKGLQKQIDAAQIALAKIQAARMELSVLETEAEGVRKAMDEVNADLNELTSKIYTGSDSTVEWAVPPSTPDLPSFPELWITLTCAIFLGLALALGIAFLREVTDTTVRSPRDIARVGNISLLGMIPHQDDDPQSTGARLPLAIFDAPQSVIAEQFRQIRTRLQHAASLDTTRSLLVTSASAHDGKTTVAVNLAAGLALNGRKILLVDANFRRPELHRVFEVGNDAGFSDVLDSLDNFESCVHETQVPNLSVLVSGSRPANPTELLESQLLIDFIERALEEYDHVIFDSGPLPLVSETIALAPRVDGVLTVVRAATNSRGLLQRIRDELRKVKAENLGVVLNAVRAQVGGYYGRNILDYYKYQNGQP